MAYSVTMRSFFIAFLWLSLIVFSPTLAQDSSEQDTPSSYTVKAGESLSIIAQKFATDVDTLVALNNLSNPNRILVGQTLLVNASALAFPDPLPYPFTALSLEPSRATTGRVQRLEVQSEAETMTLSYLGQSYPMLQTGSSWTAWLATSVLQPAGLAKLELEASYNGQDYRLSLPVQIQEFAYERERIRLSPQVSSLLKPQTSRDERAFMEDICSRYTPEQYWQQFRYPVAKPFHTSDFGTLRAYNDGGYTSFHGGLDLRANEQTVIYAPTAGVVSFAGELAIRGNTVILDHGLGLCSGYMHLSRIDVREGERVAQGSPLGMAGATGLVTAAHLHWEMRLMSVVVNPQQWLQQDVLEEQP